MGLLCKENKIKATAINIFDGNVDISYVNPILHEILQNIFNELPPHLIISRCINYHGKILELEWDFTKYQQVSWMDFENCTGVVKSKVHTGFTCRVKYLGCVYGEILFNAKLLEVPVIYDCVRNLFQRPSAIYY